ncbi:MAG TPA: hypothetical protein VKY34_04705 [Xanthomarina sp.]|nr:hypothetical protein [Xanthomarina sp.]
MKNLICSLKGHDYRVIRRVTDYVNEYQCMHCKKQMSTNENGALTPLTPKQKEINSVLNYIHRKKKQKAAQLSTNY